MRQFLRFLMIFVDVAPNGGMTGAMAVAGNIGPFEATRIRWASADIVGFLDLVPLILARPGWREWVRIASA